MDTKKLRQKILDLAIRGKLVPQDPNDEPASVLLDRIRAEKERLIAEGKIKRPKKSKSTSAESQYQNFEPPFEIPTSWKWVKITDISTSILYGVSESAKSCGHYQLLRITDIQDNCVDWSSVPFTDYDDSKANQYLLANGDILFARTGATVGKSYLVKRVPSNCIYASYLIRIKTSSEVLPEYLKLFFESGFYWQQITDGAVGVGQPNVNGTTLGQLRLPVPPKNEQIKIVIFVNSLFGFIDNIEASNSNLLDAIALSKSKILDLAMQGKLVPQDPADEPAADMLRRVNPKAEIITDNPQYQNFTPPFEIPKTWEWVRLSEIANKISAGGDRPSRYSKVKTSDFSIPIYANGIENDGLYGYTDQATVYDNSITVSARGTIGFCKIRKHPYFPIVRLISVIPKQFISIEYLYFALTILIDKGEGSSIPQLTVPSLTETLIPIPPLHEQMRIASKIEELYSILDEIEASLQA